ncbi:hypothetical protein L2E82_05091 [Cichorium intybus]|uniref:Uncharacterized protein n=1 Tax=Cichorium intybus TaxID=13427 RepID=A0ACB9H840_CICIN|nr:hypothetical protein L2E82_05091 [Cichorium intybus]
MEASAYGGDVSAKPSPIDVKDCSTVMYTGDVTSDLGRLPSTRPTVNSDPAAKKHGMKGSLFNPINDNFSTLEKGLNIINCAPPITYTHDENLDTLYLGNKVLDQSIVNSNMGSHAKENFDQHYDTTMADKETISSTNFSFSHNNLSSPCDIEKIPFPNEFW